MKIVLKIWLTYAAKKLHLIAESKAKLRCLAYVQDPVFREFAIKLGAAGMLQRLEDMATRDYEVCSGCGAEYSIRTSQCPFCLYLADLPGFVGLCPSCGRDTLPKIREIRHGKV